MLILIFSVKNLNNKKKIEVKPKLFPKKTSFNKPMKIKFKLEGI
jgi:hypothetical protein